MVILSPDVYAKVLAQFRAETGSDSVPLGIVVEQGMRGQSFKVGYVEPGNIETGPRMRVSDVACDFKWTVPSRVCIPPPAE